MPHTMERHRCPDSGIYCMVLVARFHQLPADPAQLQHEFGIGGQVLASNDLLRCARHLHLKARLCKQLPASKLAMVPLPAIARQQDGHYVVVASYANDQALVHDPRQQRPLQLPLSMFLENWTGELMLLTRGSGMESLRQRFGLRWLLPSLLKYRQQLLEVLLASFFLQLFALVTPLFFQVVIDKVLVHGSLTTLDVLAFGLLVVSVFDVVLGTLRNYLLAHTGNRIDVTLGARLFNHLLALPSSYFKARRLGDTVARVRELDTIRQFLTGSSLTLVIDLCFTAVFFALMVWYSPQLSWIVAASIPCYILLSLVVTPILRQHLQLKFQHGAENQAFLVEAINGIDTLKSMAVEPQIQRDWEDKLASYINCSFKALKLGNIASQIAGFINKVVTIMILWVGASLVIGGALSVGQLIAFNMLASRVSGPVLRVVQLWQDFQQAGISMQRLGDILNAPKESGHNSDRTTPPALQGRIEFDHLSFRYRPDAADALHDISLRIEPGEVIGIVGHSGSGKSTMAKLLQRLYTPSQGRLRIDGMDLSLIQAPWLRRQIGVVQQESFLFNRSVKDNIALANPGLDIEHVIAAAKIAGAHDFISELPEGYDTPVGEQGCIFSGGQKQRIAIARALIGDPPILIFDEATSALDYESEYLVQTNMRRICKHRTVLIIAHRLSAVQHADRIIVLSKGRVVEHGGHQQLLRQGGYYAGLFEYQSRTGASTPA